jgi:hypothetical protein
LFTHRCTVPWVDGEPVKNTVWSPLATRVLLTSSTLPRNSSAENCSFASVEAWMPSIDPTATPLFNVRTLRRRALQLRLDALNSAVARSRAVDPLTFCIATFAWNPLNDSAALPPTTVSLMDSAL